MKLIPGQRYKVTYNDEFSFEITLLRIIKSKPLNYEWLENDGTKFVNRQVDVDALIFRGWIKLL